MIIIPGQVKTAHLHALLLGAVAPRPICFASTIDYEGRRNLSPFSFFNVFGSKPPIVVFSPARRVRDNTIKHTLENILQTNEVVINMVSYSMVQQMSLASCEYPKGTDEFIKAGFTPLPSTMVGPFCVAESPVNLECKVLQVLETGKEGGAANLVICEVLCMHVNDAILDADGKIDPDKIDLVARMGGDYYCRASGSSVFKVPKPNAALGIGIDALPQAIRHSKILTGNDLGILGNCTSLPLQGDLSGDPRLAEILSAQSHNSELKANALHRYAHELLENGKVDLAWQVLLAS